MIHSSSSATIVRQRIQVKGVVQGVGFRPFVYGLARQFGLVGFVGNDSSGVFIEIEGEAQALNNFRQELLTRPPRLAKIDSVRAVTLPAQGTEQFTIVESQTQPDTMTLISSDLTICEDCLRELFDPQDRRYRYPFINCTNCGPRFTIIESIPYDRPLTTMRDFALCPACAAEYHDPLNRRFHAQPTACPNCGPQVSYLEGSATCSGDEAINATRAALANGKIVAIKGIGGFHLACDATSETAVATLRARKGREDKPFAVMVRDLITARLLAHISETEAGLLCSDQRPIVLLRKQTNSPLAEAVAPGNPWIGLMLPYSPLHYLLIDETPLVMTSGNASGEPIVKDNGCAQRQLGLLADAFLLHNRDIHVPCDDSVMRIFGDQPLPVRRSRGYAPAPITLPYESPPLLAVGGELKNTLCLAHHQYAFLSQHIGDLESLETRRVVRGVFDHLRHLFRIEPQAIICDSHPAYGSSRLAADIALETGVPLLPVQHHHAHIASVMVENGLTGTAPVIGISFDGTGYGKDGAIWGGEILIADYAGFRRAAHLAYVPLPGGDAAIRRPYRAALAHLYAAGIAWNAGLPPVIACPLEEQRILRQQLATGLNCVPTSSIGRLFDTVAALIGLHQTVTYEAQAAIALEGLANSDPETPYVFAITERDNEHIFDAAPVLHAIIADLRAGVPSAVIAARFHEAVAGLIVQLALVLRQETSLNMVALSGGVFQNVRLLDACLRRLQADNFHVLIHRQVPPNDGGLALGQAAIGAWQMKNRAGVTACV